MDLDTNDINWVIDRLAVYSRYMNIEPIPIITFEPHEIRLAVKDNFSWFNSVNWRLGHKGLFGFCIFDRNRRLYNPIIYINYPNLTELKGLHHYTEPQIIKKRYHTYSVTKKIGHLEETLIHELLHIGLKQSKHTKKFDNTVHNIYNAVNKTKQIYTS